jgi:uncharacterized protein involved in cysteine biosynthesis
MRTTMNQPNYFHLWLKWMALSAFFGFGFGIGMAAFGWHDAAGRRVVDPSTTLGIALVLAAFFAAVAGLSAGVVNGGLALAFRNKSRPRNFLTAVPLSARVLTMVTAIGLGCGFLIWVVTVRK